MGVIKIITLGSSESQPKEFSALTHGHANAVAQAIEYLAKELLPWSIGKDHELHENMETPTYGFSRKN